MIFLHLLSISALDSTSNNVGYGMPSLDGNNSCSSINSTLQILSAILRGIGGEHGPTVMASVELLLFFPGEASGANDHTVVVDGMPLLDAKLASKPLPVEPELPENVFAPAELGKTPIVWEAGVVVLDELPVGGRLPVNLTVYHPNPLYSLP